jgi:hypothetical protein
LLLHIALFSLTGGMLWLISLLNMSDGFRFAFSLIFLIAFFLIPIVIYSYIDFKLISRAVSMVGLDWCNENKVEYVRTERHKNHFAVIYNESGKQLRKKCRIHFFWFKSWTPKKVEWLLK